MQQSSVPSSGWHPTLPTSTKEHGPISSQSAKWAPYSQRYFCGSSPETLPAVFSTEHSRLRHSVGATLCSWDCRQRTLLATRRSLWLLRGFSWVIVWAISLALYVSKHLADFGVEHLLTRRQSSRKRMLPSTHPDSPQSWERVLRWPYCRSSIGSSRCGRTSEEIKPVFWKTTNTLTMTI